MIRELLGEVKLMAPFVELVSTQGLELADGFRQDFIEIFTTEHSFARRHIEQCQHDRSICVI
jgi:hypothetical protein